MPAVSSTSGYPETLTLNGGTVSDLRAIEGLEMEADIAQTNLGPAGAIKKHVSNVRWTPASLTVGLGMGKPMADWLKASLAQPLSPASGEVVIGDAAYKAQRSIAFSNAVLTRLIVPALDGASKEPGTLLAAFEAEQVKIGKGDGRDIRVKAPKAKAWIASNFRIEIGNLPCARVARIESFSWACGVATDSVGIFRDPAKLPAKVTVPDLQLTISAADHAAWAAAAQAWFVDGKHLDTDEMAGRIVLLGPDMKAELAIISFANIGFRRFQTILPIAGEKVARFAVTLYAEAMALEVKV
ncbi:hypothetical protein [Sphingomonas sp.]|uniref:hypothetical protein n=1 Tax=Sphingomonas sp. TaxID=28214 RepID=UPI002600CF76|nr:hypothetical protein [Sphingomonas sp.]